MFTVMICFAVAALVTAIAAGYLAWSYKWHGSREYAYSMYKLS